ncbi:MOLPALP family lipoprotein [Mesoplasma coleopterae]|uniref:MOLPALP family lipoprotein n=1 Tax=Mesoplasma coleopterae TaxID=324078 RepID=A0A2K8P1Z9_9MOLU|nr:MOLPALP family lipoprotein [Mesoplasma coleopterae]ATZ20794.1 MOLPALP family lipoprotein [Mesoplasma coleopterae]
MKKMLLSLTAVSMLASSTATVSCTYTMKAKSEFVKSIQKIINVANVSAEAQILTSSNTPNSNLTINDYNNNSKKINGIEYSTTNANISYSYTLNNFSGMKASQFLPKEDLLLSPSNKPNDDNTKMDRYLFKNYGSNWVNNINSSSITNNDTHKGKKTGSSSITSTASLVSSIIGVVLGSDFSVSEAGFLNDNIATILNQLPDDTKLSLAKALDELSLKFETLPVSLKESFSNPLNAYVGKTKYEAITEISSKFWADIFKKGTGENSTNEKAGTLNKISSALHYIFTLMWYIQEFANIIDKNITPDDLSVVLSEKIDANDVKNYDQINLNKTFKILNNFLNPGRDIRKAKNLVIVLFGIPSATDHFKPKSNIIVEPIFQALSNNPSSTPKTYVLKSNQSKMFGLNITEVIKFLTDILKANNSLPKEIVKEIIRLLGVLQEILASENKDIYTIIQSLLNEAIFKPLTEDGKSILLIGDILYLLAESVNAKNDNKVVIDSDPLLKISSLTGSQNPFKALYEGGLLKSIFQIINYFTTKDGSKEPMFSDVVIKNFKDLSSIFNTKMDIIFTQMLNINYDSNMQFLYGLKNSSIATIVDTISKQFIDPIEGKEYFLDLGAIRNIILSFFNSSYGSISINNVDYTKPNNLFATLKVVSAALKNESVTFDKTVVNDSKSIVNVLGLNPANPNKFMEGSIFDSIAQAYGHGVIVDGNRVEMPEKRENTIKMISVMLEGISWMSKTSEREYYNDNFGHFFDQENWKNQIISYSNFDKIHNDAEIKYNLIYQNKKYKIKETYQVTLKRDKVPLNESIGNKYFYISNITRKK